MPPSVLAPIFVCTGLLFAFLNGFQHSPNSVGTVIGSRSLRPGVALAISALADFCGPLIFGVAVATTLGNSVVQPHAVSISVGLATFVSAIVWTLVTWYLAVPASSSHALIAGLIGASAAAHGFGIIQVNGLAKVLIALFLASPLGFSIGYLFMKLLFFLVRGATPRVNRVFKRLQIPACIALAMSQGTNDAQKSMGIITMGLVILGYQQEFAVPEWVVLACAGAIALGTLSGGLRLIRTVGTKMYRVYPIDAFGTQTSAAAVMVVAALVGGPVSSTQVTSSALLGVGTAQRISKIRWGVAASMATAWLITMPVTAGLAAGLYWLSSSLLR